MLSLHERHIYHFLYRNNLQINSSLWGLRFEFFWHKVTLGLILKSIFGRQMYTFINHSLIVFHTTVDYCYCSTISVLNLDSSSTTYRTARLSICNISKKIGALNAVSSLIENLERKGHCWLIFNDCIVPQFDLRLYAFRYQTCLGRHFRVMRHICV